MKKITQSNKSGIHFISLLFCFFISTMGFSQTLQVSGNNTVIPNGDLTPISADFTDFGSIASGTKISRTFILKNTGASNLVFPASAVAISGTNANQFKITSGVILNTSTYGKYTANNLSPNFYTTIEISFEPTSTGLKTATITINLTTGSPKPYTFAIQGNANTPSTPDFSMTQLTPNLTFNYPYELFYGPDNYLWITERVGKKVIRVNPTTSALDVLVQIPDVYQTGGQDGLMGMVLDPDFGKNLGKDYVYVAYTYSNTGAAESGTTNDATRRTKIVRYTYTGGGTDGNMSNPFILIDGLSGSNDHNSGRLAIGPDKKIYYSIGDQGVNQFANKCNLSHAQDIPSLDQVNSKNYNFYEGKILRLDLDGKIPTDNPTINGVKSHIFTYGHRNVQGLVFGKNGKLYASEHGPKSDDEINILKSGNNYGWPFISGYKDDKNYSYCNWSTATNCSSVAFSDDDFAPGAVIAKESDWTVAFTPPLTTLFTIPDGFNSTGGWLTWPTVGPSSAELYEGLASEIPGWDNTILLTTLKKGRVYRQKLTSDGNGVIGTPEEFFYTQNRYRDIAIDPDGKSFYIITDSGGTTSGPSGSSSLSVVNPGTILKFTYQPTSNMVSCSAPVPTTASLPNVTDNCSVTLTAPTATNNCSGTITGTTTTVFPITTQGTTVVTWTYLYGNGLTVTQNQSVIITTNGSLVVPTFTQIGLTCSGDVLAALPTTSNNGITGIWSPTINNTTSATYIFTPNVGQCATTATMTINISAKVTPLFNAIAPICSGLSISPLPTTSLNGITGTWSPAFSNTTTKSYTFTPSTGQCTATTASVTITVNSSTTPTFTAVPSICSGASLIALPTTSNNGIIGTWSPALNNTATTTYTFTPTAGQCASTATLTITVNAGTPTIPTFTAVASICAGATLAALPTTSNNSITGTWLPALNNVATTTYTFTPTAGQCATTTTLTITVTTATPTIPTFTAINPICSNGTLNALPLTSTNGITGTWTPALNKTATTTYKFTPTAGLCATSTTLTVIVNPSNTVPTFNPIGPICSGTTLTALPTTSTNSIAGTWSPSLNNTATTTYTFTPTAGQCATTTTLIITVNPNVTPTFTAVAPICYGTTLASLPTTSNNFITGTWSPALNNTATTTYTFTPTTGQCATTTTLTITVNSPSPAIPTIANAIGQCSVTPATPTTTDTCVGIITGTTPTVFPITTQGTTVVTWTFNNGNGQSVTANQNVIIDDTVAPITPTLADVTGQCSATATAPTTTDACAGIITGTTADPLTYSTQGNHVIHWNFNDGNGQSINVNQNVIIDDTVAPITPTLANVTGQCSVTPTAPTTTDACAGIITGTTATTFPITTQGTTVVVWNFNDGNGQSINVNQNVIIDDTVAPITPTLADVTGDCSVTVIAPTTTDACKGTITGTTTDPTTYYSQGTHVIHWTFDDNNGQIIYVNQNAIVNSAPTTSITDSNFEQALIDLGFDCYIDGKVITSSINGITSLNISNYNISNLTGLQDFSSLKTLYCGNNSLTTLNVSALTNLNYLDFQNNAVTNLNITDLNALQVLVGLNNNLTTLDVSNNPNLNYLDVENNALTSLTVIGTTLTDLYCANNQLTTLNLSGLNHLDYFTAENNSSLSCIIVDDVNAVTGNVNWSKDSSANYTLLTDITYYKDEDQDGYGDATNSLISCEKPIGYVSNNKDCDDTNANSHPGAIEICGDGIDNNCDGFIDEICSKVSIQQCGSILGLVSETIFANQINDAQAYRFKVSDTNTVRTFESNTNSFRLTQLPQGVLYTTEYSVKVSVKINNIWGEYGTACLVTTPEPLTSITNTQCGTTLEYLSNNIYAHGIAGAEGYRFEIKNGTNIRLYESSSNVFKLTDLVNGANYSTSYSIRVSVLLNGTYRPYGVTCIITTPSLILPVSKVASSQCGITLATLNTPIYCNALTNGQAYRFEVNDGTNIRTYDSTINKFQLSNLAGGGNYATTYSIRIATQINNVFGAYGDACNVTTPVLILPVSKVASSQCGITLATLNTPIYCNALTNGQAYRFEVNDGTNIRTYDSTINKFQLSNLAGGGNYATTYSIRIATQINNVFGAYGDACNVTTPVLILPVSKVASSQCGITLATLNTPIYCNALTNGQAYRFEVNDGTNIRTYDSTINKFQLSNLAGGGNYATTYSIRIATQINNVFGAYGDACNVTTPTNTAKKGNTLGLDVKTDTPFILYPIPFNDKITIEFPNSFDTNSIQIQLYDISGKMIYNQKQNSFDKTIQLSGLGRLSEGTYLLYLLDENQKILLNKNIIKKASE